MESAVVKLSCLAGPADDQPLMIGGRRKERGCAGSTCLPQWGQRQKGQPDTQRRRTCILCCCHLIPHAPALHCSSASSHPTQGCGPCIGLDDARGSLDQWSAGEKRQRGTSLAAGDQSSSTEEPQAQRLLLPGWARRHVPLFIIFIILPEEEEAGLGVGM